jgi:hypothetical protein
MMMSPAAGGVKEIEEEARVLSVANLLQHRRGKKTWVALTSPSATDTESIGTVGTNTYTPRTHVCIHTQISIHTCIYTYAHMHVQAQGLNTTSICDGYNAEG